MAAIALARLGVSVAKLVTNLVGNDKEKRSNFTQNFVATASQEKPDYNVVITCSPYRTSGDSITHQHYELPMAIGTRGYEAYFSPKDKPFEFVLKGDRGFINWAYSGNFKREDKTITAIT